MKEQLQKCYETCEACTVHRNSRPQKSNEISMGNLFNNFYPNQRVQVDFCEKGADNYLVMVDVMSGFFQEAAKLGIIVKHSSGYNSSS